jgi:hypothetical protein
MPRLPSLGFSIYRVWCGQAKPGTNGGDYLVPTFLSSFEPKERAARAVRAPREARGRAAAKGDDDGGDEDEQSGGSSAEEESDDDDGTAI